MGRTSTVSLQELIPGLNGSSVLMLRAYLAAGWQYSSDDAPTISLPGAQSTASSLTTTFTSGVVCAVLNHGGVGEHTPGTLGTIHGSFAVSPTGCADWAAWQIGSRTLWNPVRNLDVGVDVLYTAMAKTAFSGATAQLNIPTSNAGQANVSVGDTHIWSGILRIQYNFYP